VTRNSETEAVCDLIVEVRPTPTADELDALLAAFAVYLTEFDRVAAPADVRPSRWARAGREAAMRARDVARGPSRASMRRGRVTLV
jgi:hypothetical protein